MQTSRKEHQIDSISKISQSHFEAADGTCLHLAEIKVLYSRTFLGVNRHDLSLGHLKSNMFEDVKLRPQGVIWEIEVRENFCGSMEPAANFIFACPCKAISVGVEATESCHTIHT